MFRHSLVFVSLCLAALAGCAPVAPDPSMTEDPGQSEEAAPVAPSTKAVVGQESAGPTATSRGQESDAAEGVMAGGTYTAYQDGIIGNGKRSLLFFHASWCPICQRADGELKSIYGEGGVPINTYKIDYDSAKQLKERYGVTYQHTFVLIDEQGNPLQVMQGPTEDYLRQVLRG